MTPKRLIRVLEGVAHLAHGAAVLREEQVEDLPPGGVGERAEDGVLRVLHGRHTIM